MEPTATVVAPDVVYSRESPQPRDSIVDAFKRICLDSDVLDGAVLTALADPRRRAILRLVRDVERPSGDIAAHFPDVTGPAISQHLRVLREAGLVAERRSGTRRLYRARPQGLRERATRRTPAPA